MLYNQFKHTYYKCLLLKILFIFLIYFLTIFHTNTLWAVNGDVDIDIEFDYDASNNSANQNKIKDPLEHLNRTIFATYKFIFNHGGKNIIILYQTIPTGVRNLGTNFANNLQEPITAVNHLLQFKINSFIKSLFRFTINSTFGLLGIVDIMSFVGTPRYPNTFGATLHYYGIGEGFYFFLFGPSTLLDTLASFVDNSYLMGYVPWNNNTSVSIFNINLSSYQIITTANNVLLYNSNGSIFQNNFDEYATIRYVYMTSRKNSLQQLKDTN